MRALFRSVVLWAVLLHGALTVPAFSQSLEIERHDNLRPRQGLEHVLRPLGELLLQQQLERQRTRPPRSSEDDVTPPRTTPPRTTPPRTDDNARPPARRQVTDRAGPVIRPAQREFTSRSRSATISATITDPGGVARAQVLGGQGGGMTATGRNRYVAEVKLPPHYDPLRLSIRAWDRFGNVSQSAPLLLRRVPVCGRADDVSINLVRAVQRLLTDLNRYQGQLDGLAGPNTCRAIAEEGIKEPFTWAGLARELENRVARRLIWLRVERPEAVTGKTTLDVSVFDPRNTGDVYWVTMVVDGVEREEKRNLFGTLSFDLVLAEGQSSRVEFRGYDSRRSEVLARAATVLTRPEALTLSLAANNLSDGRIESEDSVVRVIARLGGAKTGRIFYENAVVPQRSFRDFSGTPVTIAVTMPDPGETGRLQIWAQSDNRSVPRRDIVLERIRLFVPDVPVPDIRLVPVPGPDPFPGLKPLPAQMPLPALLPARLTRPVADRAPGGPFEPYIPPPTVGVAPGLIIGGLGLVLLAGMVGGLPSLIRRWGREHREKLPPVPPMVRLVAVADVTPDVDILGADMPGLVMTVEPAGAGRVEMAFDKELEGA